MKQLITSHNMVLEITGGSTRVCWTKASPQYLLSMFPAFWKSSSEVPVFEISWELSVPPGYGPICPLSHLGKIIEALITAEMVKHLTFNDRLSDKQYGVHFAKSTADVLRSSGNLCIKILNYLVVAFWVCRPIHPKPIRWGCTQVIGVAIPWQSALFSSVLCCK